MTDKKLYLPHSIHIESNLGIAKWRCGCGIESEFTSDYNAMMLEVQAHIDQEIRNNS